MQKAQASGSKDEFNLIEFLIVLFGRWRMIAAVTLGLAVLTAIYSLVTPEIYEGTACILPPDSSDTGGMAAALVSSVSGGGGMPSLGDITGGQQSADQYVGMLKGRTISDAIIDRFGLMKFFQAKTRVDAENMLSGIFTADVDKKSGIISIKVQSPDPQEAANMANAYVDELSDRLAQIAISNASKRRSFYNAQVKEAHENLFKAEDNLRAFQESSGAFKIDDQAKAIVDALAYIRARIAEKEIELKVMKTYATASNRDLMRSAEELDGLKEQLRKVEEQNAGLAKDITTDRLPMLGTEYLRRYREFKYQEAVYQIVTQQFATARMDEAKNMAFLQVVDRAIPTDKRVKPKRTLLVAIALVVGFSLSTFWAYMAEYLRNMCSDPENQERLARLKILLPWRGWGRCWAAMGRCSAAIKRRFQSSSREEDH